MTEDVYAVSLVILLNFHPQLSLANKGYFADKPRNSILATATYSRREK